MKVYGIISFTLFMATFKNTGKRVVIEKAQERFLKLVLKIY